MAYYVFRINYSDNYVPVNIFIDVVGRMVIKFYWKEENIRDMDGQNSTISITVTLRYALIFFVPIANHMLILKISHGKQFKNL